MQGTYYIFLMSSFSSSVKGVNLKLHLANIIIMGFPLLTKTVNMDEAVDDIVRQFIRIVARSPNSSHELHSPTVSRTSSSNTDDINKLTMRQNTSDSLNSFSDNEEGDRDLNHGHQDVENSAKANSDIELKVDPAGVPPEVLCMLVEHF